MIRKNTLFIVGAGASVDFGLPMGSELKSRIADAVNLRYNHFDLVGGSSTISESILHIDRTNRSGDANRLAASGRIIHTAMPQSLSIDNYLEAHQSDNNIVLMGKLGIAHSILKSENNSSIFYKAPEPNQVIPPTANTWHNTLCQMMTEGVNKENIEQSISNISIITFNYDRCLEYYISHWLANYYNIDIESSQNIVKRIPIVHVYGQCGRLPWQKGNSQAAIYGASVSGPALLEIAKQIRTFTEQITDENFKSEIRGLISQADHIVSLGFSYAPQNLSVLDVTSSSNGKLRRLFGTTYGMSPQNVAAINHKIRSEFAIAWETVFEGVKCNQLLQDNWYMLTG
ncbi:hypothetical protein J8I29_06735 [Labrys sp. LIt4]|uniref:hypothetical protein n=1 Tax=Labrys sp. LIt4 TaxID=2821355 RepID=UPI001ADF2CA7|nr:hypothetical protein [Labrys sp. LIt4]MBP0578994.1 hypothetical protein [Labrys sp. LIt4]